VQRILRTSASGSRMTKKNSSRNSEPWYGTEHVGVTDVSNMLTNIGILGALMLSIVAGLCFAVDPDIMVKSDFKMFLTYDPPFRAHVLQVLRTEHPEFPLQYNVSELDYRQKPRQYSEAGFVDIEWILEKTPALSLTSSSIVTTLGWNNIGRYLDNMHIHTKTHTNTQAPVLCLSLCHTHTYTQAHIHTHTHTHTHTHAHAHVYNTHTHTRARKHTHTHLHALTQPPKRTLTCTHAHTHPTSQTYTHTHNHAHTHTYTHQTRTNMQIYAYTHHTNAHTHTHIYTHAHTHAHTRTLTNTHTRTNTRTYTRTKCMYVNFHTLLYSFWTLFEKSPTTRNLSMCANMLSDELPIQRLTTINHLFMRVGMEEYVFPQNVVEFDCRTTLGTLCGLTAFSLVSFGLLSTCICGCFLMYFAVLLLDSRHTNIRGDLDGQDDFMDTTDNENLGEHQWMAVATPMLSILFFLLVGGMVSGFFAIGQVGAINFMETYFNAWWLGIFFTVSIPILVVYFVFLFWTVFMSAVSPIRNGGSNRLSDIILVPWDDKRRRLVFRKGGTENFSMPLHDEVFRLDTAVRTSTTGQS